MIARVSVRIAAAYRGLYMIQERAMVVSETLTAMDKLNIHAPVYTSSRTTGIHDTRNINQ